MCIAYDFGVFFLGQYRHFNLQEFDPRCLLFSITRLMYCNVNSLRTFYEDYQEYSIFFYLYKHQKQPRLYVVFGSQDEKTLISAEPPTIICARHA